ncbi:MAG: ammonia-forming cytochrome c nitrite reductase [Candidatus Kapaibacterium sp.]
MADESKKSRTWIYWVLFIVTVIAVFFIGMLSTSIIERRAERVAKLQPVADIGEWETDNSVWGRNYPREYESWLEQKDTSFHSKYGGSAEINYLDKYPEMVVLWAGYGFSKGYNQGRGHVYTIKDIREILRTGGVESSSMPATCWTCKSSDVPRLMNKYGVAEFYDGKWIEKGAEVTHPMGCLDCHDPQTMNLRISRPALIEALERRGKKMEDFTHQEMRSLVCAQCHVEYYFQKDGNYLAFPWDDGFSADSMEYYYDKIEFTDWVHKLSKAPMLKAQHPDYEFYLTGIHAKRGVACADCHMPYKVSGGVKFTDHHIQSPLNNVANSCQVCHRESKETLVQNVYDIQDKIREIRAITEETLAKTHIDAQKAWEAGATSEEMAPVLKHIRHAQWRWDYAAAANSMGFHSPLETMRVLATSIERAEKARGMLSTILVSHGQSWPADYPDISTRLKAQQYIGLDMEFLIKDKEKFLNTVVKEWEKEAATKKTETQKAE